MNKENKVKNNLKVLRTESGLTQKKLSEEINIPLRTLQNWETGIRNINPDKAKILADFFEVSVGYLLGFSEEKKDIFKSTLDIVTIEDEHVELENFVALLDIARYKTVDVRDKIISNLKKYYDYYGEKMKAEDDFVSEEKFQSFLKSHQEKTEQYQSMLLIGLMRLRSDIRFAILDLLSLEGEKLEAVENIIRIIADNPIQVSELKQSNKDNKNDLPQSESPLTTNEIQ